MKKFLLLPFLLFAYGGFSQNCIVGSFSAPNASLITDTQVGLNWGNGVTAVGNGTVSNVFVSYFVVYVPGFGMPVKGNSSVPAPGGVGANIVGLAPGTTYTFRALAVSSCQDAQDPQSQYFTDIYSPPVTITTLPATPVIQAVGETVSATSMNCRWSAVNGATSYDVEVTNSGGTIIHNPNIAAATFDATALASNTDYYFRVRARNGSGTSNYTAKTAAFYTRPAAPTFPTASAVAVTTTSFQAKWNAVSGPGTVSYRLDVSSDQNFNTFLSQDLIVNGTTSPVINGLTGGTTYYFRVRAVNSSGASVNSVRSQVTTGPITPTSLTVNAITINSATATWSAAPSSTQYEMSLALDANFNFPVTGYNPKVIAAPTLTSNIAGLTPSTNYFLKLRAKNATGYSDFIFTTFSTPTPPSAPTFPAASVSLISTTSFKVTWNAVAAAVSYRIDVSDDPDFGSFVLDNVTVNSTSHTVPGLNGGTVYYFRVRTVNNVGVASANSATKEVLTAPITPTGFSISTSTANSLSVNWAAAPTATHYELFVSTDPTFGSFLANYNPKVITAPVISDVVGGLTQTTYYLRVRARNATDSYSGFATTSAEPDNGNTGIQFTGDIPPVHLPSVPQQLSVDVTGTTGNVVVKLYHKKNSEAAFVAETIPAGNGTTYRIALDDSWFDSFGMEFYFHAQDQVTQKTSATPENPGRISSGVSNVVVPLASFGSEVSNYQMVSLPYRLPDRARVGDVFELVMEEYNKKKWRLFHYQDGNLIEYSDGVKASNLDQGKSYWFITKNDVALAFGAGISNSAIDDKAAFIISLKKGWNQIGNPFPYDLSWQDVITGNNSPAGIGKLLTFNPESVSLVEDDKLKAYGGGFVFAENDFDLQFVANLRNDGGRKRNTEAAFSDDPSDWLLPIELSQGNVTSAQNGVGMHREALEGKDPWDRVIAPRFIRFLEFKSDQSGYEYNLSQSVVGQQQQYTWKYSIASDVTGPVKLTWDKTRAVAGGGQLILHDLTANVLLDMSRTGEYVSSNSASILIHYNKVRTFESEQITLGVPYPNPFESQLEIPFDYSNVPGEISTASLIVYDLKGIAIAQVTAGANDDKNLRIIYWNGQTNDGVQAPSGTYLYRLSITKGDRTDVQNGKIIKR